MSRFTFLKLNYGSFYRAIHVNYKTTFIKVFDLTIQYKNMTKKLKYLNKKLYQDYKNLNTTAV